MPTRRLSLGDRVKYQRFVQKVRDLIRLEQIVEAQGMGTLGTTRQQLKNARRRLEKPLRKVLADIADLAYWYLEGGGKGGELYDLMVDLEVVDGYFRSTSMGDRARDGKD